MRGRVSSRSKTVAEVEGEEEEEEEEEAGPLQGMLTTAVYLSLGYFLLFPN